MTDRFMIGVVLVTAAVAALPSTAAGQTRPPKNGEVKEIKQLQFRQAAASDVRKIETRTPLVRIIRGGRPGDAAKGDTLRWDDVITVRSRTIARIQIIFPNRKKREITLFPELIDEQGDEFRVSRDTLIVAGAPLEPGVTEARFTLSRQGRRVELEVHSGWFIADRWPRSERDFVVIADGEELAHRGTTWAVANTDDGAALFVQDGSVEIVGLEGPPKSKLTLWAWDAGGQSPGQVEVARDFTQDSTGTAALIPNNGAAPLIKRLEAAVLYNGREIWKEGKLLPLIAVPYALIIVCVALDCIPGEDPISGTVILEPIP